MTAGGGFNNAAAGLPTVQLPWPVVRSVVQSLTGEDVRDMTWARLKATIGHHDLIARLSHGLPLPADLLPPAQRTFSGRPA